MPFSTSDGKQYDDEFSYWHAQMFGEPQQTEQPEGEGKLYLVRHGDTPMNDEDLVHGWTNTPLNDKGIEQAHKAAESLKDKDITRIVSSDLPRAKQTANILSKKLDAPITFDPNLRTWNSGDFDGTDKHEELESYTKPDKASTPPAGSNESFNDFKSRIINTITGYSGNNEGHNTLLVTHSKPIKAFNAWEHAGYPQDDSIHMATYGEEGVKPGGHIELSIPEHTFSERFSAAYPEDSMSAVAQQIPSDHSSPIGWWRTDTPKKTFDLDPHQYPGPSIEDMGYSFPVGPNSDFMGTIPSAQAEYTPVMESPDEKLMGQIGPRSGRSEGGGGKLEFSKENVQELSAKGLTAQEIANTLGVSRRTLFNKSKDWDLENPIGSYRKPFEINEATYKRLEEEGLTQKEIAESMGLSERTLNTARDRQGMRVRSYEKVEPTILKDLSKSWTEDRVNQLKDLVKQGKSFTQIAEEMKIGRSKVQGKMGRLGLKSLNPSPNRLASEPETYSTNVRVNPSLPKLKFLEPLDE